MNRMRSAALAAITTLVAASAIASFSESYRALYDWSTRHGLRGFWAGIFPLQVDVFIAVGELALFVALADGWSLRSRLGAWAVTGLGLVVSVAGNVGHVQSDAWTARATASVPPVAAAAALAVGLGVLKRVQAAQVPADAAEPAMETPEPVTDEPAAPLALTNGYHAPEHGREAAQLFADKLAAGNVPGVRTIRETLHIGQRKAMDIRDYLAAITPTGGNG